MQMLYDEFNARTVRTEMEVQYWSEHWKRCDYITRMSGPEEEEMASTAVSVTRAMAPPGVIFSREHAIRLFENKLYGLVVARAGIMESNGDFTDGFFRSMLHIFCRTVEEVEVLRNTYEELSDELQSDITVLVTRVTGDVENVF